MSYQIDYGGMIKFSSKKKCKEIEKIIREKFGGYDNLDEGCTWGGTELELSGYNNRVDEELRVLCLVIAKLDRKARGEIRIKGEDSDDIWMLRVEDGKVYHLEGVVKYIRPSTFDYEKNELKQVYEVTQDKETQKELMLKEIEK